MSPTASDELRAEWPGGMEEALEYLRSVGIKETGNGIFIYNETTQLWSQKSWSAIQYLCDEWDFACGPKESFQK